MSPNLKLIDTKGYAILTKGDFIYYEIIDKKGLTNLFIKTDLENSTEISKDEYHEVKFGKNHKEKHANLLDSNDDSVVLLKDSSVICLGFRESTFYFIDKDANLTSKREDIGFDSIYSFDLDSNGDIWYVTPTAHCLSQYSLEKNADIYHLGEKYEEYKPLSYPEDIKIYGGFAYISDMGSKRVIKLNLESKAWVPHLTFEESVWEYRQWKGNEIVRLSNGIYSVIQN